MRQNLTAYSLQLLSTAFIALFAAQACFAAAKGVPLEDLVSPPKESELFAKEKMFGYRGKVGGFVLKPSRVGAYYDQKVSYYPSNMNKGNAVRIMYLYKNTDQRSFCGAYVILMADLSEYKTMAFMIKGRAGGETCEVGINDMVSNKREDAVFAGSINRYLKGGVTRNWKEAKIPLSDFYGIDMSRAYSLIFSFRQEGHGTFWVDDIRFYKEDLAAQPRAQEIQGRGFLLLDDFDYSDLNLLGRKASTYKKLPSVCVFKRTPQEHAGAAGRALELDFKKEPDGWCGYYTMLNQVDGEYYDLTPYKSLSFMVKGKNGGETFEIGLADKNWTTIGDSLKAGPVDKYLAGGVTTKWQEAVVPLEDFGLLDLSQMGSFVINFNEKGEGTVYIDDLKFYLKEK